MEKLDLCDLGFFFAGLGLCIMLIIFAIDVTKDAEEESCVRFYRKNNYITESCEVYRQKLELIDNE